MSEVDLRKKIEEFGKGSFDIGVEQIYSAFVGAARFFGVKKKYRTLCETTNIFENLGLAKGLIETGSLVDYLISAPTTQRVDAQEIRIRIEKTDRYGLSGYAFSKDVRTIY